jgi:hypothetical protein
VSASPSGTGKALSDLIKLNSAALLRASELYRPSDRHLSAKLVKTSADSGCRVVSATDPLRL